MHSSHTTDLCFSDADPAETDADATVQHLKAQVARMDPEVAKGLLLSMCANREITELAAKVITAPGLETCDKCGEIFEPALGGLGCHFGKEEPRHSQ